jgi:hypothetical protein
VVGRRHARRRRRHRLVRTVLRLRLRAAQSFGNLARRTRRDGAALRRKGPRRSELHFPVDRAVYRHAALGPVVRDSVHPAGDRLLRLSLRRSQTRWHGQAR